jgi:hypothetical protein
LWFFKQTIYAYSSFHREVDGNCALLGYYAVSSDNFLPKFRDNLYFQYSRVTNPSLLGLKMGPMGFPESSVRYYHCWLRSSPQERSTQEVASPETNRFNHIWHASASLLTIRFLADWHKRFQTLLCPRFNYAFICLGRPQICSKPQVFWGKNSLKRGDVKNMAMKIRE